MVEGVRSKNFSKRPKKLGFPLDLRFYDLNHKRVPVRTPLRSGKLRFYDFYECHYLDCRCHTTHRFYDIKSYGKIGNQEERTFSHPFRCVFVRDPSFDLRYV